MEITTDILERASQMVTSMIMDHQNQIDSAFSNMDETLDINCKVKLSMNKEKFKIQTDITFTSEKIKDSLTVWYDPDQKQLFDSEPE
jgi:hypothetical protein